MAENGFAQFYLDKVALGEGCRCAEMVVAQHERESQAATARDGETPPTLRTGLWSRLRGWLTARRAC